MLLLSIIIPVYNAEKYIEQTLSSIIKQAPSNIEVIIVNDGSTDNSVKMIESSFRDELQSGLLKLLEQDNKGVSVARNNGIRNSRGEYVAFIDADDFILNGYFESIMSSIEEFHSDIIEFGCKQFNDENDIDKLPIIYTYSKFGKLIIKDVIDDIFIKGIFYPPLRVIKRKFLTTILFPANVKFCEDLMFFSEIYQKVKTTVHIPKALYAYRVNHEGATKNVKPEYIIEMVKFYLKISNKQQTSIKYLKVNVFFIIYKLHEVSSLPIKLSNEININRIKLFFTVLFDMKISLKKKVVLFSPNLFLCMRKIFKSDDKNESKK